MKPQAVLHFITEPRQGFNAESAISPKAEVTGSNLVGRAVRRNVPDKMARHAHIDTLALRVQDPSAA